MQCVSAFLSDGDGQMMNSMKKFITAELLNPKTKYRGCFHYGVTQVLLSNFSKDNKKAGMIRDAIKCFMNWCGKSFTENEVKHH